MSGKPWAVQTLPDGRRVEYVDAVPVTEDEASIVIDVTVLLDDCLLKKRVTVPKVVRDDR